MSQTQTPAERAEKTARIQEYNRQPSMLALLAERNACRDRMREIERTIVRAQKEAGLS